MTIPVLTYSQLIDILSKHGYSVIVPQPQDFFSDHNRIIIDGNGFTFPLQFKDKYFYLQVVHLFRSLDIPVPEDHQTCYNQHIEMRKRIAEENAKRKKTIEDSIKDGNDIEENAKGGEGSNS